MVCGQYEIFELRGKREAHVCMKHLNNVNMLTTVLFIYAVDTIIHSVTSPRCWNTVVFKGTVKLPSRTTCTQKKVLLWRRLLPICGSMFRLIFCRLREWKEMLQRFSELNLWKLRWLLSCVSDVDTGFLYCICLSLRLSVTFWSVTIARVASKRLYTSFTFRYGQYSSFF